uniref:START domain-containing protein n=1 Tax=Ditylenchus dipsaci TaxID=166011 RepID=A0A915D7P4_9BILA
MRMRFARYFFAYRVRFTQYASSFARNLHKYGMILRRPQNLMIALSSAGFSSHKSGLSDEEFDISEVSTDANASFTDCNEMWEHIYQDENIQVSRRKLKDKGGIYEYKCTGSYDDISANHFVQAQIDDEFRSHWDQNVISLETIEKDDETDSQVVRWVACKALSPKHYPDDGKYVRVTRYKSRMTVSAHTTLDKPGLDYALVYYDDPKTSIPSLAYNYAVSRRGPDFMKSIYVAAKKLADHQRVEK